MRQEFLGPFCMEDFDMVGLFCHVDEEHVVEAKNGLMSYLGFSPLSSKEGCFMAESTVEDLADRFRRGRVAQWSQLSDEGQEEEAQQRQFI